VVSVIPWLRQSSRARGDFVQDGDDLLGGED
jgi:hypothetical protein